MTTKCIDCGKNKAPAWKIGSWQCDVCQTALFNRLRTDCGTHPKNYEYLKNKERVEELLEEGLKGYQISEEVDIDKKLVYKIINDIKEREKQDMSLQTVEKLMDEGLKAKDIAERTELAVGTVYQYMSKVRGKDKRPTEAATKTKAANKAKKDKVDKMTTVEAPNKELDKLRKENKQLQERIEELKDVNGKAGDQIENLKDKLKKMTNQQQMIDELKKENESLEHDYKNVVKQQKNAEDLLNNAHKQEIEQMKEIHNEMRSQIEHKDKEIHRLYGEKQDLSNKIDSLEKIVKLANDRADMYQDKFNETVEDYRKEKQKHELLYNYVTLEKEVM